jgi:hypothetical protein
VHIERRIRAREREAERRAREFDRRIKARERSAEARRRAYEAELRKATGGEAVGTTIEQRATNALNKEARNFSVNTTKAPETLLEEAKKVAENNGATFSGDTNAGSFSGRGVEGWYEVDDGVVKVTVTDKPGPVSWSTVESKIEEFFN